MRYKVKNLLSLIIGCRVRSCDLTLGDAGILFDSGASLAIYNKFFLSNGDKTGLKGRLVINAVDKEDKVIIFFDDQSYLEVALDDNAYSGPEAMQLRIPGKPIVVWN